MRYISQFIKRDDDDVIFVDYLGGMQDEGADPADWHDFLRTHRDFIEKNMVKFKEHKRVLSKYLWLKKYHNAVAQTRLRPGFYEDYLVNSPEAGSDVPLLSPMIRPSEDGSSDDEL